MITIYNIRGTNGSGKTTLARSFIKGDPAAPANRPNDPNSPSMVDLYWYSAPTKRDPGRRKVVEGYAQPHGVSGCDVLVLGSYRTACGGLDALPDFETTFAALERGVNLCAEHGRAEHQAILAEGILASTVWGSWGRFAEDITKHHPAGVQFAFCYLDTPLEVCLARIKERQERAGKVRDVKEDLVADKIKAIAATRQKALEAGALVYDLPYQHADAVLRKIIADATAGPLFTGDRNGLHQKAREFYRARA